MQHNDNLLDALRSARDEIAVDAVTSRRREAQAEGERVRRAMLAEREGGDGSPDAA